jgi:RNA polymerase primary sigma factor
VTGAQPNTVAARNPNDELVTAHMGFVVRMATRYRDMGVPLEDLIHEGTLGLIEAARRYDPARGTRFLTFAVWWIRKSILTALDQSSVVRVPEYERRRGREMRSAETCLTRDLGRRPDMDELSRALARSASDVERTRARQRREVRLYDRVRPDDERTVGDGLCDAGAASPEAALIRFETGRVLLSAVHELGERERRVLGRRYGLDGESPQILRDVGRTLGISRERVRQIEDRAIERLRRILVRRLRARVR